MNEAIYKEIYALKDRVKSAYTSNVYDATLANDIFKMLNKLREIHGELEKKYNEAKQGSPEERNLLVQGEFVVGSFEYFSQAYAAEKRKNTVPAINTGAVTGQYSSMSNEPKENNGHGLLAGIALVTAATALFVALLPTMKPINTWFNGDDKKNEQKAEEENETSIPKYNDASNTKQIEARASWYYDTYFNSLFSELSDVAKVTANEKTLADNMPVLSGEQKLYTDFNAETDIMEANNAIVQQFCSYLSLDKKTGKVNFVPSQYLYLDGSYAAACAAEVDAVLDPLSKAMKRMDDEAYKKYATEFGVIMAHQYYYPDITDGHYNVRGMADSPTRIHLWSIAYAEYTNKIMTYGLDHGIDVCIPFCIDHTTGEMVEVPLSKLMAMLEFVPVYEWDAVLARAGITIKQLEEMGNEDVDNTMPVVFTADAKNHYEGMVPVLN